MWPFSAKKKQPKPAKKGPGKHRPAPAGGRLAQVTRKLYARDESAELITRQQELQTPTIKRKKLATPPAGQRERPVGVAAVVQERAARRGRLVRFGLVALALLALAGLAAGATLWYRLQRTVTAEDISVTIEGPTAFTSSEQATYTISYRNNSRVDWHNVELAIETPPGFSLAASSKEVAASGRSLFVAIGNLPAGAGDAVQLTGQLLAAHNATLAITAELTITPENFPSGRFSQAATATTTITNTPLSIGLDVPGEAASGELVKATLVVTNTGAEQLEHAFLELMPAVGLQLATEDPQFSPEFSVVESRWNLGSLEPLATVTRDAVVVVQGAAGESRTLDVQAGIQVGEQRYVQQTQSATVAITASELTISQSYNEAAELLTVRAGEPVAGVISYANTGSVGLRDVVVTAAFDGEGLDASSLDLPGGNFNPTTRTITWTAATVPELALLQPGQAGEIPFSWSMQETAAFPIEGESTTTHALVITAQIDSPDVVVPVGQESKISSNRFVMSVASELTLEADAYYDDGRLGITSTGPTPPEVGQQTTYTVRLRLGSTLNDLGDVRVAAVLPDGVRYTDETFTTVGELAFNDRTGELIWSIPLVPGLTGRAAPVAEAHFQVAITPGDNQRGDAVEFLNSLSALATDLFTDTEATVTLKDFPSTSSAVPGKGDVQ